MATVSVSYLWIALKVRGAQERAAGEAIFGGRALPVYLNSEQARREPANRPRRPQPPTKGLTGGLNRQPDFRGPLNPQPLNHRSGPSEYERWRVETTPAIHSTSPRALAHAQRKAADPPL